MTDELHPNFRPRETLPVELRDPELSADVHRWLASVLRRTPTEVTVLDGASSTAVHRVEFDSGPPVAVKRYLWPGFLVAEPIAPRREVAALKFARGRGLAAPEVLDADLDGAGVGDGVPTIVMSFLPGRALRSPDVHLLAEVAAAIHAVPAADFEHEWFDWYADVERHPPEQSTRPDLWERAIDVWLNDRPEYEPTFIHRDFHPGNVLWAKNGATGIVDWANGCRGPRGCDIAHCCENLLRLSGPQAADQFAAAYQSITGIVGHPYWEITSVLEHDLEKLDHADVTRSETRLEAALAQL